MRIQHNIMAMNAYRNYTTNTSALSKNLEKLSSGYRINRAGDDAAGLAISEKMRAQITGLATAQKNAKDGISLVQTAEGALTEVHDMLNRMVELAGQSANGTYDNDVDRANLQKEFDALRSEIDRIADSSNFNGIKLLDGSTGLNTEAFSFSSVDAVAAKDVTSDVVTTDMPNAGATVGTDTILHTEGTTARQGEVTIDLSQLAQLADGTDAASVDITINGKTFTATAANATTDLDGKSIATLLTAAINGHSDGGLLVGSADDTGLIYTATDNGDGTITLKSTKDGAGTALTDGKPTSSTADANLTGNWTVTAAKNATSSAEDLTGAQNIGTTNIVAAQKDKVGQFANTFIEIDVEKITDGMVLEIAGEKYTFAVGEDSSVDLTGAGVVDLTDLDLSDADDQTEALNRLTRAAADNATFSVGHDGAGNLTLAEKTDGAGNSLVTDAAMLEKLSTLDGMKSLVSFTEPATNKGTKITTDVSKITEGDALNIDGKTYVFTTDPAKVKAGQIAVEVSSFGAGTDAMSKLQEALENDGYATELAGDDLTIFTKNANDQEPQIIGKGITLQIGDTSEDFNQLTVAIKDMHTKALGIDDSAININTQADAKASVEVIKNAINSVSSTRGDLGALQNRLEHTINNLAVMQENIQDAEATIRDVDVAEEMMSYTKNNILVQSAQAMLAQANQIPQGVLQLLG